MLLNADLGEHFGAWQNHADQDILPLIDQANIATGFHAGDPFWLLKTITAAQDHQVQIGAHIGYRDLNGFGRRNIDYDPEVLYAEALYQLGAIKQLAQSVGATVSYCKPHGALYNRICAFNETQAEPQRTAILRAMVQAELPLMVLAGSPIVAKAKAAGLTVYQEAFADRAYQADGSLVPRSKPGAVHSDPAVALAQAQAFAAGEPIKTIDGQDLVVHADSLCVHGDTPQALTFVREIRAALK